ncbi:GLUG motif-containing protein, partial [Acinetobacter baumannii]
GAVKIATTPAAVNWIGGLVGKNTGLIQNSSATGSVTGGAVARDVGGLVGLSSGAGLQQVSAAGAVSGKSYVGGLVGQLVSGAI